MINWTIRRSIANGAALLMALCGVSVSSSSASDAPRVRNQEYRFSVEFPVGVRICTAISGEQPHGFFVRLNANQSECVSADKTSIVSVISVSAYSNATFKKSPEAEIAGLCRQSSADDEIDAMKGLSFVGRRSARCQVQHPDGSIDIYVVTQAGQWPGAHESQELNAPYINYTASLHTTQSRMSEDLKVLRKVLNSVHIGYPK